MNINEPLRIVKRFVKGDKRKDKKVSKKAATLSCQEN